MGFKYFLKKHLSWEKGKNIYLLYAVLLHALVNYPVVIIPGLGFSIWFAEFYLLLLAIVGYVFIVRIKRSFPEDPGLN